MPDTQTEQTTQRQVTSKEPNTKARNPKQTAAGKTVAAKTKQARDKQKKALAEARVIIANNQIKEPAKEPSPAIVSPATNTVVSSDTNTVVSSHTNIVVSPDTRNVLTTTQWLSVISILFSILGIYYKREETKNPSPRGRPRHPHLRLLTLRVGIQHLLTRRVGLQHLKEKASAQWIERIH